MTSSLNVTDHIRARARDAGVRSLNDTAKIERVAREVGVDVAVVKRELAAVFERTGGHKAGDDMVPAANKTVPGGKNAFALLSLSKTMASSSSSSMKPWNPIARLPEKLQARLSDGDRRTIEETITELQRKISAAKLDHVPVFGYLSLRTHNFAELGKKSQSEVVIGKDVVDAKLPGWDVDVVASTMYRGTPEHPGAVAGLSRQAGASCPGVVLKVPLDRAEELLAVVLAREMFAEADLVDLRDEWDRPVSNAMYAPRVENVVVNEGRVDKTVPSLVFTTNERGDKALLDAFGPFGDVKGLSVERLAYLFAAQGGFIKDGKAFGGPAVDYWQASYVEARKAANQPLNPKIAEAVELSKLLPQEKVIDEIAKRTDDDALLMQAAMRVLFNGMFSPLLLKQRQKEQLDGLVRSPQGTRGEDAEQRLLAKAKELQAQGKLDDGE